MNAPLKQAGLPETGLAPLNKQMGPWPQTLEAAARIVGLRDTGMTMREIGERLGLSKNQVIGIVWRAGMSEPRAPAPAAPPQAVFPERGCLWPLGDPGTAEFHFCGAAKGAEGPYCGEHRARAYLSGSRAARAEAVLGFAGTAGGED
jgi:GcrA cell cycle regulator